MPEIDDIPEGYISMEEVCEETNRLNAEIFAESGETVCAVYRCVTCGDLATNHPDSNVKGCKKRELPRRELEESYSKIYEGVIRISELIKAGKSTANVEHRLELQIRLTEVERQKVESQRRDVDDLRAMNEGLHHRLEVVEPEVAELKRVNKELEERLKAADRRGGKRGRRDHKVFSAFLRSFRQHRSGAISDKKIERKYDRVKS